MSENSSNGSKLRRSVPENNTGSWGIIEIFFLKSSNAIVPVSMPSIKMFPSTIANLNKAAIKEDFPAPVLPTMPT